MYKVRLARESDDLVPLVVRHSQQLGFVCNVDKIRILSDSLVSSYGLNGKVSLVLVGQDDIPYGYIYGIMMPSIFTDETLASEIGFYCEVKGQGKELVKAFETWAKENGATQITLTSHGTDRLDPYYERLGYKVKEKIFVKELN